MYTHTQVFFTSGDEVTRNTRINAITKLPNDAATQDILNVIRTTLQDADVSPIWDAYCTANQMFVLMVCTCAGCI